MRQIRFNLVFWVFLGSCGQSDFQSGVVDTVSSGEICTESRTVEVGIWGNGGDCSGDPAFILEVPLTQACFGWERSLENGETRWNSATRFQCYQDRVCYSQHPDSDTCEAPLGTTDKEWRSECSAGTKLLSGTDDCPPAPGEGCSLSDKQVGTEGVMCLRAD
jgi:hypothetical protein